MGRDKKSDRSRPWRPRRASASCSAGAGGAPPALPNFPAAPEPTASQSLALGGLGCGQGWLLPAPHASARPRAGRLPMNVDGMEPPKQTAARRGGEQSPAAPLQPWAEPPMGAQAASRSSPHRRGGIPKCLCHLRSPTAGYFIFFPFLRLAVGADRAPQVSPALPCQMLRVSFPSAQWVTGRHGGVGLRVGLGDLRGLFQP